MTQKSGKEVIELSAASPEELNARLAELKKTTDLRSLFAAVAIAGPQVVVRQFYLQGIALNEVDGYLRLEAVEFFSLPAEEIEINCQILQAGGGRISGVYISLPKKLLRSYLFILDKAKLIPQTITAASLVRVNTFLKEIKSEARICLLDFSQDRVCTLSIFHKKQCELIRDVPYENLEEIELEVQQSLKSANAKSTEKDFSRIYLAGNPPDSARLVSNITENFETKVERVDAIDAGNDIASPSGFFNLNAVRRYGFSLAERRLIFMTTHLAILLCVGGLMFGCVRIMRYDRQIDEIQATYDRADYRHAIKLQEQIRAYIDTQ